MSDMQKIGDEFKRKIFSEVNAALTSPSVGQIITCEDFDICKQTELVMSDGVLDVEITIKIERSPK